MSKRWGGPVPEQCDLCDGPFPDNTFVDGRTQMGPWAIMCRGCHLTHGFGLGTGKGQKYHKTPDGWIKIEG